MILRKDYVKLIKEGKAQVEMQENNEEHNKLLNILFKKRRGNTVSYCYFWKDDEMDKSYNFSFSVTKEFPVIKANDIILNNTVIKVTSEEQGKKVVEWWKNQGVSSDMYEGNVIGYYYGVRNEPILDFYTENAAKYNDFKIMEFSEEKYFPKKWYLKITKDNLKIVNDWRNSLILPEIKINLDENQYLLPPDGMNMAYIFTGNIKNYMHYNDYTEIKLSEFIEHIYNPFKKEQKTMKNPDQIKSNVTKPDQKIISYQEGQEIIDAACPHWKDELFKNWGRNIVLKETIKISEQFYQTMRKACTSDQHILFDKIFGKYEQEINLNTEEGINDLCLFEKNGSNLSCLIAVRRCGNLENKSFYLNEDFNWKFETDDSGTKCLVPTFKK